VGKIRVDVCRRPALVACACQEPKRVRRNLKKGWDSVSLKEQVLAGVIRSRLSEDKRIAGQTIDVFVSDGDIVLLGTVDDESQRETADTLVRGIVGVREVTDRITVRRHIPA